jgi:hypothetical protein
VCEVPQVDDATVQAVMTARSDFYKSMRLAFDRSP